MLVPLVEAATEGMAEPLRPDEAFLERLRACRKADPEAVLFALREAEPVGLCVSRVEPGGTDAALHLLAVHPSAHRAGLGRWLEARAADLALGKGTRRLRTARSVDSRDRGAVGFLTACGWRPAGAAGIRMHRTLEAVPLVEMPSGYTLRTFRDVDAEAFVGIRNAAFLAAQPAGRMGMRSDFEREYLGSPHYSPERVLFVERDGQPVGTTTAWTSTHEGREVGLIHWVAVDPAHQRRGLGEALNLAALHKLKQLGYDEAILNTNEELASAVSLYGRLGFREAWRRVAYERRLT